MGLKSLAVHGRAPAIVRIQSDLTEPTAIARLRALVIRTFPTLNVLIKTAGIMRKIDFLTVEADSSAILSEVQINLAREVNSAERGCGVPGLLNGQVQVYGER
jgi:short-subunit dehydrogenase involved in D-alanine esterification of teichoic acids